MSGNGYDMQQANSARTGAGGQLSRGPVSDMPESPSKIRDVIGSVEIGIDELHQAISLLEQRLDTVLTPEPPSVATNNALKNPNGSAPASHLFGRGSDLSGQVANAVRRVQSLMQRIEI